MNAPSHRVTVGHIRLSLAKHKKGHEKPTVTAERRFGIGEGDWSPAATFTADELPLIGQAVQMMRDHLQGPPPKPNSPKPPPSPSSQAPASPPATRSPSPESPPFVPNVPSFSPRAISSVTPAASSRPVPRPAVCRPKATGTLTKRTATAVRSKITKVRARSSR